jgi:hypothetical protein
MPFYVFITLATNVLESLNMVVRTFLAFDNDSLEVTSSGNSSLVGNGIINNSDTPVGTTFSYSTASGQIITLDDTGGSSEVFEDDDASNHVITDGAGLVADGQIVEAESFHFVRALDADGNPTGPVITITVFSEGGATSAVWGLSSDIPLVDGTEYVKTGGSNLGSASYEDFVTCFAAGTAIDTPDGPRAIEELAAGDLVNTRDNGVMPIIWAGHRRVLGRGKFAPICIAAGALNNSDLLKVSPEHRMLVEGPIVELLFDQPRVLVAAKHLVGLDGVSQDDVGEITYYHMLFDSHQIIRGAGCWSESFFLNEAGLAGLDCKAAQEIRTLFPELHIAQQEFGPTIETVLKKHEAYLLKEQMMLVAKQSPDIHLAG